MSHSYPFIGLSVRAQNCLGSMDISTKEQLMELYKSGELKKFIKYGCRNFGPKTYEELEKFMWGSVVVSTCPICGHQHRCYAERAS